MEPLLDAIPDLLPRAERTEAMITAALCWLGKD